MIKASCLDMLGGGERPILLSYYGFYFWSLAKSYFISAVTVVGRVVNSLGLTFFLEKLRVAASEILF